MGRGHVVGPLLLLQLLLLSPLLSPFPLQPAHAHSYHPPVPVHTPHSFHTCSHLFVPTNQPTLVLFHTPQCSCTAPFVPTQLCGFPLGCGHPCLSAPVPTHSCFPCLSLLISAHPHFCTFALSLLSPTCPCLSLLPLVLACSCLSPLSCVSVSPRTQQLRESDHSNNSD